MTKYQVQYKPINEATNGCITNKSLEVWSGSVNTTGGFNPQHDMILYFKRTATQGAMSSADFSRIPGDFWCVYAETDSIKGAMVIAKILIKEYGSENVQICKIAPCNIEVVFEE